MELHHKGQVISSWPLGAAAFVSGVDFYDHIQHDYAIRHVAPTSQEYEYRTLVASGTEYPTTC